MNALYREKNAQFDRPAEFVLDWCECPFGPTSTEETQDALW